MGSGVDQSDEPKPLVWIGSSLKDLRAMPRVVMGEIGHALYEAQRGLKYDSVKPLKGFGGGGVLEVVEARDGDAFRCVYTVRLAGRVYVLHAFQKKSKSGVATPKKEMDVVQQRLRLAEAEHARWLSENEQTDQRTGKGT